MPNPLPPMTSQLVSTHAFFTNLIGGNATTADKQLLATKLLLYEVRGRPWDSRARDLDTFEQDCIRYESRPDLGEARDRLVFNLDRYTERGWAAGDPVLRRLKAFPGAYWGIRWSSGSQWEWSRDIVRAYYGLSSPVSIPAAKLTEYQAFRRRRNDGDSNLARARLTIEFNPFDRPPAMPQHALVDLPKF